MILSALTAARLWFGRLPDGLRVMLIMAVAIVALFALTSLWLSRRDAEVIERHEYKREAAAAPAREKAAEDRAQDAINNMLAEKARELEIARAEASEAAKAPEARATLSPQALALNCERLRQAGMTGERAYKEACR